MVQPVRYRARLGRIAWHPLVLLRTRRCTRSPALPRRRRPLIPVRAAVDDDLRSRSTLVQRAFVWHATCATLGPFKRNMEVQMTESHQLTAAAAGAPPVASEPASSTGSSQQDNDSTVKSSGGNADRATSGHTLSDVKDKIAGAQE